MVMDCPEIGNMAERKALSKRTRFEIFKRDEFTCQYCGQRPPQVILHIDHVLAVANGGTDDVVNLITSCEACNLGKSDVPLGFIPERRTISIEREQEKVEQMRALNEFLLEQRAETEAAIERLGLYWFDKASVKQNLEFVFNEYHSGTIRRFLADLPEAEIFEAIDIAYSRKPWCDPTTMRSPSWKYFCGICWNKIRRRRGEE